jgi:hypothetical protein
MKCAEHAEMKRIGRVAWPGALVLIVLLGLAPGIARAEDDQSSNDRSSIWNLDKKMIYELLRSFSLTPKSTLEDQIDYHERPPLVVPPSRGLPAPQTSPAARDPNWPVEAHVSRQAGEKRKTPRPALDPEEMANPVRPSELRGAAAGGAAADAPNRSAGDVDMTETLRPSQLGSPSGFFSSLFGGNNGRQEQPQQQVGAVADESPRTRLIEPPAGYQTPSPSQPYGTARPANYGRQPTTRHDDPLN